MPARTLMIQGTGSHVGKSVLVAALCRLFVRRGLRVAPFKAQNMSNNSFVTPDGKEIGRAQAVQAAACRLPPHSDYNPILIKPSGERDAQLVVNGEVAGRLTASDFGRIKREFEGVVRAAFDRLRDQFDLIVLEGAGSPAEVNLRQHDVVNMYMAKMVNAPVVLVGDIDRGGVLAALVGTMELLDSGERALVKGFLVNKFRGAQELLMPGIKIVEEKIRRPCLGIVPFSRDIDLPEEDAVVWNKRMRSSAREDVLTIGVVDVPCLSNFTDFDPLAYEPDVTLHRITDQDSLVPDLLVFPGSKHTIQALRLIRERRIDRLAHLVLDQGGSIIGICGGYQILGKRICDPDRVESQGEDERGLGLIDVVTTFRPRKVTEQVSGYHRPSDSPIEGYEVHMGHTTRGQRVQPFLEVKAAHESSFHAEGAMTSDGRICGTYVHGLFDEPIFRRHVLNSLRSRREWLPLPLSQIPSLDQRLDQWADFVESQIDFPGLMTMAHVAPI